ncbi:MAG: hypothetical protein LDL41_16545 [Coleofasciculus sp. S288]|nr:hypothetical protein [Coleofasciculus sp. S288]
MTPTSLEIQRHIHSLEIISQALTPKHPKNQEMLKNAIDGDINNGIPGELQHELLMLYEAKAKIEEAIAALQKYQEVKEND